MARNKFIYLAVVLATASHVSLAQDSSSPGSSSPDKTGSPDSPAASTSKPWSSFQEVDKDRNGFIEQSEAASVQGLDFAATDADSDQRISRSEYEAAKKSKGAGKVDGAGKGSGSSSGSSPSGGRNY